jgi:hypothetical protein
MVRDAMYRSEFEVEKTKRRMQPFKIPGRCLIPDSSVATTKGEAEAELEALLAKRSSGEL